ncbi:MAG TPA: FecR domain-containing protein, partial [Planctomycetota bacterium]|nr:FecR domain-containing protein [Planctomycetota bacterium]
MCQKWGSDFLLDHVQGRLSPVVTAQVAEHLEACESCRRTLEELRAIESLSRAPAVLPGPQVEQNVLAVLRQEAERRLEGRKASRLGTRRIRFPRSSSGSPTPFVWAAAAAAIFLIVLVYAFSQGTAPRKEPPAPIARQPETVVAPPPSGPSKPPDVGPAPALRSPEAIVVPALAPQPQPLPAPTPAPEKRDPPPTRPEVVRKPEEKPSTTVAGPVEFGRIVQISGKAEAAGKELAREDRVRSGEPIVVGTGSLILETGDRSLIVLRSGAKLTPRLEGEDVALRLVEGEGVFSVTRKPDRRFVVETSQGTVTVKGTVFSVRAGSASAVVVVAKGKV